MTGKTRCGFIAIVGRTNVGKSTLFNSMLDEKLSIATRKPQTTRHNIQGILSLDACQLILIDTPGIQLGNRRLMNKVLARNVFSSLQEVDVILMLVELDHWKDEDEYLLTQIKQVDSPVIAVMNKIDKIKDKYKLLPMLDRIKTRYDFTSIIPFSALYGVNKDVLTQELCRLVPDSEFLFPENISWNRDDKFVISEVVRGVAMSQLQKEVPYAIYTEVEEFDYGESLIMIVVIIWVERESQRPIVIGKKGAMLKTIGEQARIRLEKVFNKKVVLKTWVKVKQNWQNRQEIVAQFEQQ